MVYGTSKECLLFYTTSVEATQALLEVSVSVNATNRINGATPLHCAIQSIRGTKRSRLECIRLIITVGGANVNIQDSYGKIPLDYLNLIQQDDVDGEDKSTVEYYKVMRSLLTPSENSDMSLLLHAIESLDMNQVQEILSENKQLINQHQFPSGLNPLLFAVDQLMHKSNTTIEDASTEYTHDQKLLDIIDFLLDSGADPNSTSNENSGTLPIANSQPKEDINLTLAPLHILCKCLESLYISKPTDNITILLTLEKAIISLKLHGAMISQDTIYLMHDASRRNNVGFVSFLIEKLGIDPNTKGRQGLTPLHFAARSGHIDVVEYLLNRIPSSCLYKVDSNILDDLGMTALDAARVNGKDGVVELLTREG